MGKKNKGGRGGKIVVCAQDISSFNASAQAATTDNKGAAASSKSAQVPKNEGAQEDTGSCETKLKLIISKIKQDPERQSIKDLADHFFYLDNKLI